MTEAEYKAHIARREREIKHAIQRAVEQAVTQLLEADAEGEDKLGVKYTTRSINKTSGMLAGFKDGIGISIKVETAYLPTLPKAVA